MIFMTVSNKKKLSTKPKTNEPNKILRWISRNEQMERNGGGQFVAVNRIFKDKKKYDRKKAKQETRKASCFFYRYLNYFSRTDL